MKKELIPAEVLKITTRRNLNGIGYMPTETANAIWKKTAEDFVTKKKLVLKKDGFWLPEPELKKLIDAKKVAEKKNEVKPIKEIAVKKVETATIQKPEPKTEKKTTVKKAATSSKIESLKKEAKSEMKSTKKVAKHENKN